MNNYLSKDLNWHESETRVGDITYKEWNYYSRKKYTNYKILQRVGRSKRYVCLALVSKDDTYSILGDTRTYDTLMLAKRQFIDLENS